MNPAPRPLLKRLIEPVLDEYFTQLPAVMLVGPRACGKTTLAASRAKDTLALDRPGSAEAVALDPDAVLRSLREPLLIDEWQNAPGILGAVKRAVDHDPRPGRFLLTGSANVPVDSPTWPGTGRVLTLPMWGMNVAELNGNPSTIPADPFDAIVDPQGDASPAPGTRLDLADYLLLATRGGYPEPGIMLSGSAHTAWLASYLDHIIHRDIAEAERRDSVLVGKYVRALALTSAGVVTQATLLRAAGINRLTADAYDAALQRLFLLDLLPAWSNNRLSRLVKMPKRYLTDAALLPIAFGLDMAGILRDGELIGRMLDTFVASQLRTLIGLRVPRPGMYHLRDADGAHEVDIILELPNGKIVAIEIKASSTVTARDARHLVWLRDRLGDQFQSGVVFHTGPFSVELSDRIRSLPISALWS